MKNKIIHNWGLKIISLIVGFLFWLFIVNSIDPIITKTFSDIPVEILNENIITTSNQVYDVVDGEKVDVTVKGKRSFVLSLDKSDFEATADMSELSSVNAVRVSVKCTKKAKSSFEVSTDNAVLKVKLEKRITRKFKVAVETDGELANGYVVFGDPLAKPNLIEISAGQGVMDKIDHVGVTVALNNRSENFESELTPILYTKNNEPIDSSVVILDKETIRVSTIVARMKEVPVKVATEGNVSAGYKLDQIIYKPEKVRVAGPKEALDKIEQIEFPPINIEGAKKDIEKNFTISNYISKDLKIQEDFEDISVRCQIEKKGRRTFYLTQSDIEVKNQPENSMLDFEKKDEKYKLVLFGKEKYLKNLTIGDLGAYIELRGMMFGSHLVDVLFDLPSEVTLKKGVKVNVILSNKDDQSKNQNQTNVEDETESVNN